MNLIRATLRALVEETLKLRFGGANRIRKLRTQTIMVKPIFKPWLKITGVLEKGHELIPKCIKTVFILVLSQCSSKCTWLISLNPPSSVISPLHGCVLKKVSHFVRYFICLPFLNKLDDGWPESEKHVFQAALRMVVVKDSR